MSSARFSPIDIGNLTIPGNIMAAPMAGYTDRVGRRLALEGGAALAWTEMISAEALVRGSARTEDMMKRADGESLLAVQLFGADPDVLGRAASRAAEAGAVLLDLNAGCPVPKVTGKGAGAAMGRDPERLGRAVRAMNAAGLPVSVKIRSGWDEHEMYWKDAAAAALEAGAAMLGFHPRTRRQGYGGHSDWSLVTELTAMSGVPVIGSGDLNRPEDAGAMLERTGCAGVMFARGAIGDPGIYRRSRRLLETGSAGPPPDRAERLDCARRHLQLAAEAFGEEKAAREMKKHLAGYIKGWESAAARRHSLVRCSSFMELRNLLDRMIRDEPSFQSRGPSR